MGRTYKVGPSGSFGARYGTVARKQYSTLITALRTYHECPQCHLTAVKRESVGIWACRSCGFKFSGGAYVPRTKLGEVAERASRVGVASTLEAEQKAEQTRKEIEAKAKAPKKRRRRAVKKAAPKPSDQATENAPEPT
jgi:large subunit ribosomal protein L37Ae